MNWSLTCYSHVKILCFSVLHGKKFLLQEMLGWLAPPTSPVPTALPCQKRNVQLVTDLDYLRNRVWFSLTCRDTNLRLFFVVCKFRLTLSVPIEKVCNEKLNGINVTFILISKCFFRLSQNVFSRFSRKNFFLDISSNYEVRTWKFRKNCHFVLKISDKNRRSSWGSDIPLELILYPCCQKSSWALFNRFYGFILFLNSWIFQIQFEEHLRMKYSFRILGLSWKNL